MVRCGLYGMSQKYVLPPSVAGCEGSNKMLLDNLDIGKEVLDDLRFWIRREVAALLGRPANSAALNSLIRVLKVSFRRLIKGLFAFVQSF